MFLYDLVSSKIIVIWTIIFTLKRGESHILRNTNKQKLLVVSHVILDYTCNPVYLFQIPGGKYIIDFFSDDKVKEVHWVKSILNNLFLIFYWCVFPVLGNLRS